MYIYGNNQKRSEAIHCTKGQAVSVIKDILSGATEKQAKHLTFTYNK